MNEGKILPYLDIPFQHASPSVLKNMRRPAHQEKTANRIHTWKQACPDLTLRSTFIVGFPGETEEEFQFLLDWLEDVQLDRVGCFKYEPVDGAKANDLGLDEIPEEVKQERWERFMAVQQAISTKKLAAKVGTIQDVIIDAVDEGEDAGGADGRTKADAPEIDGRIYLRNASHVKQGDIIQVKVEDSDEYDLFGVPVE